MKATPALVNASRKLKPYFELYVIILLSDLPLKQVLHKPEALKRLMKWTVELGEHEIEYQDH